MELNPSILIGNGFNIALSDCINKHIKLDYQSISIEVRRRAKSEINGLYEFLEKNKSECDLELLLSILKNSVQCLKSSIKDYCICSNSFEESLNSHRIKLKELVIQIMTDPTFHPEYKNIFHNNYLENCKNNLNQFDRIYTINYDLILYWFLNNQRMLVEIDEQGEQSNGKFTDGFSSKKEFRPLNNKTNEIYEYLYGFSGTNNKPNIFFLHGALHLLQGNGYAYKVVKNGSQSYLNLLDLRKSLINEYIGFDNLIVFDATSYNKIQNIYSNSYLEKE